MRSHPGRFSQAEIGPAAIHKNGLAAGGQTGLDVPGAVAQHEGADQVDVQLASRSQQQSRLGLTTIAVDAEVFVNSIGVMEAVVDGVQVRPLPGQASGEFGVHRFQKGVVTLALGHPWLVGHHDCQKAHLANGPQRLANAEQ